MKYRIGAWVLLLLLPVAAHAQGDTWAAPTELKTETRSNWFPSVTVDPQGHAHIVWSSGKGEGEQTQDLLMYTDNVEGDWRSPNDIVATGTGGWAARNSLTVDRAGRLHLLVRSRDRIYYTWAESSEAWSAQGWAPLHMINGIGMPYYSAIAIDSEGTLHVVYQELTPRTNDPTCIGCSDVWYRRSTDGGTSWSSPIDISQGNYGSIKLQLVIDQHDQLYVTWDEGKDPNATVGEPVGVAYTTSADHGITWAKPQQFKPADAAAEQMTLGVAGNGDLVMVFRTTPGDELLFRQSSDQGRSWSDPEPLPGLIARDRNETPWDKYSMATDSAGNVHLLAVARLRTADPNPHLFHLVWNVAERTWSEPELIADDELHPEWPQLVVANGNQLHATWFTRNRQDLYLSDTTGTYRVWYSTRSIDAPAISIEAQPTVTPLPSATPIPPTPTAQPIVPLSTEQLDAPQPTSIRSELPMLRSVGLTLLPPLSLCVVVLLIVLRKR